jgi:hypothetical protein
MSTDDPSGPENLIAAAIDAAEGIRDPLDGLVEKAAADPGAPFAPDVLERLAALKKEDRAAFETLRARLKRAGCRVTALDEALVEERDDAGRRGPTKAAEISAPEVEKMTEEQFAAEITRLAVLSPIEYHRHSRDAAKKLGIDRPTLTRLVSDAVKLVRARRPSTAKGGEMPSDLAEALAAPDGASEGPPPYETKRGGILWRKETKDGPVLIPLTNFSAVIASEIELDNGVERNLYFEMQAELGGRQHKFEVPAAEFCGMSWVSRQLGAKALLYPGFTIRDHARAAIQILSPPMPRRRVFSHLGWRQIEGKNFYLHSGGAIGSLGVRKDVETDLGELSGFTIAEPPVGDDLRVAIAASSRFVDAAPARVTIPLYACIWRSVIDAADFTLHLTGQTGVFKSELAALAQQHFGAELDARRLASWSSTGNALEAHAFAAKDALLVVDDFAPGGSQQDVARLQREAARLIRAQGNRSGRQRMRPDGSLRPIKPPRGLILSTGEDIPIGESIRARMLIVEVRRGDVDTAILSDLQEAAAAGMFARALAGFLQHAARDLEGFRSRFREERRRLRSAAGAGHARTAWLVADLGAALRLFLQFADEEPRWEQCWKVLLGCIATQDEDQQSESPAQRFMALVGAAISSKRAHIGNARDPDARPADAGSFGWQRRTVGTGVGEREDWLPIGPCIGWTDGETVSLEPESAYALAQKLAMESGHALGVGPKTLWKRLDDADLIARKDEGRSTTKALIGSKRRRVLVIEVSILQESGQWGRSGHNGENPNEFYRLSRHDSHGSGDARIGRGIGAAHPDHRDVPEEESGVRNRGETHDEHQHISGIGPDCPDRPDFVKIASPGVFRRGDGDAPSPGESPEFDLLDDMPAFLRRGNGDPGDERGTPNSAPSPYKPTPDPLRSADANRPPQSAPKDGWTAEDWRNFFDERTGIAEFDFGLSRPEVEARVFACCVAEWLNRNPARSSPGSCLGCVMEKLPTIRCCPSAPVPLATPGCTRVAGSPGTPRGRPKPSPCWRPWGSRLL